MNINLLLDKLETVRPNGPDKWIACCPAHPDRDPSLSISHKEGRILMHCHAGCAIHEICGCLGIGINQLFDDPPEPRRARRSVFKGPGYDECLLAVYRSDRASGVKLSREDKRREFEAWQRLHGGRKYG